jgi:hypothetical protein
MSINQVRLKIEEIISFLKERIANSWLLKTDDGSAELVSLGIIGRDVRFRRIDHIMDFDTLIILRGPMTIAKYNEVEKIFQEITSKSTDEIGITFWIADGAVKPLVTKKINLFFHVLLHTIESYQSSPLLLVKNSWQHETRILFGLPPRRIQTIPEPSVQQVLNGKFGIKHCRELLNSMSSTYLEWVARENNDILSNNLSPVKFTEPAEAMELCYFAVLRGASNALRLRLHNSRGVGIGENEMRLFEDIFYSFPLKSLPTKFLFEKIRMRQGLIIPKHLDMSLSIEQSLEFLTLLDAYLSCIDNKCHQPLTASISV